MFNFRKLTTDTNHRRSAWLTLAVLVFTTFVLLPALTVSARTWFASGELPIGENVTAPAALPQSFSPQQEEKAVIRLLTSGFSPTEVNGTAGQYRLVMTRRSRDEQVTLQLKRANGELVQEIVMPQEKPDWTTLIELEAGSYTLTVTSHPDWVCHITVQ